LIGSDVTNALKTLILAIAVFAAIATTSSAEARQGGQPNSGSMMDHGMGGDGDSMMGHSGMMGGMGAKGGRPSVCAMMTGHIEGRLALLKAELNITPEQASLWNDYTSAVRDNANSSLMSQDGTNGLSLPDRLDTQEQFMAGRLDGLRATSKVLKALYGSLSDTQKQTANELIRSSTGMMRWRRIILAPRYPPVSMMRSSVRPRR
jgi:LTXXQ motif family protein